MKRSLHHQRHHLYRFILLLAAFLSGPVRTAAQTATPQILPAQERAAPILTTPPALPAPLLATSFLLPEAPGKPPHFSYLFAGAYDRDQSLATLSPVHEVKTLFLTQSSVPLMNLWGGRLRLDGFTSRIHIQDVQLGPSAAGGLRDFRPSRLAYPSGLRSVGLTGLSLSFRFGRDAQIGRPEPIWRCLAHIVNVSAPH